MADLLERILSPTPQKIKTIQKITTSVGTMLTMITGIIAGATTLVVPAWVPIALGIATTVNHTILQCITQSDIDSMATPKQ